MVRLDLLTHRRRLRPRVLLTWQARAGSASRDETRHFLSHLGRQDRPVEPPANSTSGTDRVGQLVADDSDAASASPRWSKECLAPITASATDARFATSASSLLDALVLPARPAVSRSAGHQGILLDRTSRQERSNTAHSICSLGRSEGCGRRVPQRTHECRSPDRTRDAMDKAPPCFGSHGFCYALLYNQVRPHEALGYRSPQQFSRATTPTRRLKSRSTRTAVLPSISPVLVQAAAPGPCRRALRWPHSPSHPPEDCYVLRRILQFDDIGSCTLNAQDHSRANRHRADADATHAWATSAPPSCDWRPVRRCICAC
jgi:hypothetical protein